MVRIILITIIFFTCFCAGYAQKDSFYSSFAQSINIKYKLGFLIAHREAIVHLPKSHFQTIELSYDFHTLGNAGWQQTHKNPRFGVLVNATFNENREVLGNAFGLGASVLFPKKTWGKSNAWSVNNKVALGLGYITKTFDVENNPKNNAIGSHMNFLIVLGVELEYRLPDYHFSFGLDFTHYSNSGIKKPNLGLNIPSLRLGMGLMTKKSAYNESLLNFHRDDLQLLFTGIVTAKNNYDFQNRLFPVFALSAHLSKAQYNRFRYVYGIDLVFSEANRQFLASSADQSFLKTVQVGIYNGWELDLSKVIFSAGMGVYAYNPLNPHGWFFHRIGCRIDITRRVYFHGYVRSHWAKADFFESGIGYKIGLR